jgi:hypothetical protein
MNFDDQTRRTTREDERILEDKGVVSQKFVILNEIGEKRPRDDREVAARVRHSAYGEKHGIVRWLEMNVKERD